MFETAVYLRLLCVFTETAVVFLRRLLCVRDCCVFETAVCFYGDCCCCFTETAVCSSDLLELGLGFFYGLCFVLYLLTCLLLW